MRRGLWHCFVRHPYGCSEDESSQCGRMPRIDGDVVTGIDITRTVDGEIRSGDFGTGTHVPALCHWFELVPPERQTESALVFVATCLLAARCFEPTGGTGIPGLGAEVLQQPARRIVDRDDGVRF